MSKKVLIDKYLKALDEIAESHSCEDETIDGSVCFIVSCGCEFCKDWIKYFDSKVVEDETL